MSIIILTEPKGYSKKAVETLKKLGPVYTWNEVIKKPAVMREADILVVKLGMKISREVIARLPHLAIIGTSTTGLNHIDMEAAEARGVRIASLRGETKFLKTITPTAEETIGLIIGLMRKLPWAFESIKQGEWNRERFYGNELYGRTLGIIGFGRLGSIVTRYAKVFGMRVIAADPFVSDAVIRRGGAERATLQNVFRKSDVVSLHVLLTPKTENMITKKHFRLMRPHAYFVNTARGELIDETALLEALKKKQIAGAALDVLWGEDPSGKHLKDNPLLAYARTHDNLFIVPHLGGASFDAMARTEEFIAEKIIRELKQKTKT
ncbi:MAG: hydroxyacid dehydrogenase [Candidatus Yanofskybacteria bacterium]|nr:hydroxyacid dehydrogenase [Candidatus Yanofskybacteria bacterium]